MVKGNWREFENPSSSDQASSLSNEKNKSISRLHVEKTKAGKKGKTVTIIRGLSLEINEAKLILKNLKIHCGTGGTVKEGIIELQGNHVKSVLTFFASKNFN